MNVSVVGSGYVGLITAAGLAERGHKVVCVDIVRSKVDAINRAEPPIYEAGLDEILRREVGVNLRASVNLKSAVLESDITFICVGTPSRGDGSIDLRHVRDASTKIARVLREKKGFHVVVVKSTVIPGTTDNIITPLLEKFSGKKVGVDFGVAMNPEFLREGVALEDFRKPDRIIVGTSDYKTLQMLENLYADFKSPVMKTSIKTAEMIKYSSNAFLAAKISFINETGNICKKLGIDVYDVAEGMGLDKRISHYFLRAGLGFGGSCFPKDVKSLACRSRELGVNPRMLQAVLDVNEKQPKAFVELVKKRAGGLKGRRVAVLGLAFKGGTDDIRESPAVKVVKQLLREKAVVVAYDPKAMDNARMLFRGKIKYAKSCRECLKDADMALVVTEWDEFRSLDFSVMKNRLVFDARRMIEPSKLDKIVKYEGLCW